MALFVPAGVPFTIHWYAGVMPPLTGVAVKVTAVPAQTGFALAETDTLTGSNGLTVIVTVLVARGPPHVPVVFWICL